MIELETTTAKKGSGKPGTAAAGSSRAKYYNMVCQPKNDQAVRNSMDLKTSNIIQYQ